FESACATSPPDDLTFNLPLASVGCVAGDVRHLRVPDPGTTGPDWCFVSIACAHGRDLDCASHCLLRLFPRRAVRNPRKLGRTDTPASSAPTACHQRADRGTPPTTSVCLGPDVQGRLRRT